LATAISRRQFLRGDLSGRSVPLRPPWALAEADFVETCNACGACIPACPQQILRAGTGGFPHVDFGDGECVFCAACVDACAPRALAVTAGKAPWELTAVINEGTCLAMQGVECRSCVDPCESRAIRISYRVGGVAVPGVLTSRCSGCGACYRVCPVQAIDIHPAPVEESV